MPSGAARTTDSKRTLYDVRDIRKVQQCSTAPCRGHASRRCASFGLRRFSALRSVFLSESRIRHAFVSSYAHLQRQ